MAPPLQHGLLSAVIPLAALGYGVIGWALSSLFCGLILWGTDGFPEPGHFEVHWQGLVGTAMGYGIVATAMAALVWPLLCLARALRWRKGWWVALALANGLLLVATLRAS